LCSLFLAFIDKQW